MAFLDQSMPISQYLIIKKKIINCTFIIHKNGNTTSIQPILKSNSASFMFNNMFCGMKVKKVIHWEGARGSVLISSWKCHFSIYLYIISKYITWISKQ